MTLHPAQPAVSSPTVKQHERWRKFRAKGRLHFVLAWGLGFWGGLMFLVMGIGFPILTSALDPAIDARASAPGVLAATALLWAAGGVVFGALTWHFSEKKFSATEIILQGKRA